MLLTSSPKTRLPQHSTGWRPIRRAIDRASKRYKPGPADWVKTKHRAITTDEAYELIKWRVLSIRQVTPLIKK